MPGVFRRVYRPPTRRQTRRGGWVGGTSSASLANGTASLTSSGPGGIVVAVGNASGGTPSYTYLWYRSVDGGSYNQIFNGGGVSGASSQTLTDGSATTGYVYRYKNLVEDSALAQAYSNEVGPLIVYTGGTVDTGTSTSGTASYGGRFDRGMTGGING